MTRAQAREYDRRAADDYGLPTLVLMENAGRSVAEWLQQLNPASGPVCVLCGPGNNGGDGFVIARHLLNAGAPVSVWLAGDPGRLQGDARVMFDVCRRMVPVGNDSGEAVAALRLSAWVVDALYGTGLNRAPEGPAAEWIAALNDARKPVLAVDIPSGLDADTGEPLGVAVRATHTATFVAPKAGFAAPGAAAYTGAVRVFGVGAPAALLGGV